MSLQLIEVWPMTATKGFVMTKKTIAMSLLAAMALGSTVSADSYFTSMGKIDDQGMLKLGEITSDGDGVIEVFDFRQGERGDSLGTATINQGANMDVRVNAGKEPIPIGNVLAVLTINGATVATHRYEFSDE